MSKKEGRLSPTAKKLLQGARERSVNPKAAVEYLMSVPPIKLNMYDRQKIGREIMKRRDSKGYSDKIYSGDIIKDYSLDKGLSSRGDFKSDEEDRWLSREETQGYRKKLMISEFQQGSNAEKNGDYGGADEHYQNAWRQADILGNARYENLAHQKRKHLKQKLGGGLESKTAVTTAIIGFLGSIFFFSNNITGNVIGNSTSSNWIGGILFAVGLMGAFFYFRSRK